MDKLLYHLILYEVRKVLAREKTEGITHTSSKRIRYLNDQFKMFFGRDITVGDIS